MWQNTISKIIFYCGLFQAIAATVEVFSAVSNLEKLIDTENQIFGTIESYLNDEETRLKKIRDLKNSFQELHSVLQEEGPAFIGNPINSYILIKRLTKDLNTILDLMNYNQTLFKQSNLTFPSQEDLDGAATALLRLQKTYLLESSELAKGVIRFNEGENGVEIYTSSVKLSLEDAVELGKIAFMQGDDDLAISWIDEAATKLNATICEDLSNQFDFITYQKENATISVKLSNSKESMTVEYKATVNNNSSDQNESDFEILDEIVVKNDDQSSQEEIYESLCRGEKIMDIKLVSKLRCFYLNTTDKPVLRLSRIKIEEAFRDPDVLIFYDVISSKEIDTLKGIAGPRLNRSLVRNAKTGAGVIINTRISKTAWLTHDDHETVRTFYKRVEDLTGLTSETAESLQVINYGLGGYYDRHYDASKQNSTKINNGMRISTWLTYISDVDAGGATVFPKIKVTAWPVKGSAVFWYNLHKNGTINKLMLHAGCPVLLGSKWATNLWFNTHGQEFKKPCSLHHLD